MKCSEGNSLKQTKTAFSILFRFQTNDFGSLALSIVRLSPKMDIQNPACQDSGFWRIYIVTPVVPFNPNPRLTAQRRASMVRPQHESDHSSAVRPRLQLHWRWPPRALRRSHLESVTAACCTILPSPPFDYYILSTLDKCQDLRLYLTSSQSHWY